MAKRGDEDDDKRPTSDEDAPGKAAPEDEDDGDRDESASDEDESDEDESDDDDAKDEDESDEDESDEDESDDDDAKDESDEDESDDDAKEEPAPLAASAEGDEAEGDDEESEEVLVAGSLGVQRYVYSAFFASVMLGGFVLGRALETLWARVAVSDWAVRNVPAVTGVPDESKATYSFIAAGVIAVVVGIQTFRKEHVRKWSEEVSSELLKVKWPTRKEVYASTVVVLATSAIAVAYLFLLDRFWGFITDKIYGLGS